MPSKTHDEIIELIKNKEIKGISIDTCIFQAAGYKFDGPLLQALKQFSTLDITIIFCEIITSEIKSHINIKMQNSINDLNKSLKDFQKQTQISDQLKESFNQIDTIINQEFSDINHKSKQTLDHYLETIQAQALLVDEHDIMRQLHDLYFQTKAPFENNTNKKNEFPDAIALLSLERWIKQKEGYLIVVSNDKGWQKFSNNSENIIYMEKLDECLGLFNLEKDYICSQYLNIINNKFKDILTKKIEEIIISTLEEKVYFDIEAPCYYEIEQIDSPKINQWHIDTDTYNIIQNDKKYLTISCYLSLNATFYIEIEFSEEIDKYYVGRGSIKDEISKDNINIILTVNRSDNSIEDIEIEQNTNIYIFCGAPEPDYDQFCGG